MPKYTIADIAREAGVSKSTVSRYFNQGYVKDETKEKIQAVIERTGFEPSAAASNLKAKQTRMIGVVAPTMTSPSTGRLLNSMDNTLRKLGYACLIITTDHQSSREIAAIEYLRSLRVDGIVLIATNLGQEHQALQKSSSIPFLVMGQKFPSGISIIYDDYQAGFTVGEYAYEMGHRNVTYIGVSGDDFAVGHERKRGVLDGLSHHTQVDSLSMKETTFSYDEAREVVRSILDQRIPDLIICATDQIALACFKEVRQRHLHVPEDVSIIGFGGYDVSALLTPALATVHFQTKEAGELCARTLVEMIQDHAVPKLQVLGFEFDPGQSVSKRQPHPDQNHE
ncbi:MAG: LacI family DNA-binding transcriptional regulator [Allobaculum sp.]